MCGRFKSIEDNCVHQLLAYCISLLINDHKNVIKLMENKQYWQDKLLDEEI